MFLKCFVISLVYTTSAPRSYRRSASLLSSYDHTIRIMNSALLGIITEKPTNQPTDQPTDRPTIQPTTEGHTGSYISIPISGLNIAENEEKSKAE